MGKKKFFLRFRICGKVVGVSFGNIYIVRFLKIFGGYFYFKEVEEFGKKVKVLI